MLHGVNLRGPLQWYTGAGFLVACAMAASPGSPTKTRGSGPDMLLAVVHALGERAAHGVRTWQRLLEYFELVAAAEEECVLAPLATCALAHQRSAALFSQVRPEHGTLPGSLGHPKKAGLLQP
jgi:hypothetical protein